MHRWLLFGDVLWCALMFTILLLLVGIPTASTLKTFYLRLRKIKRVRIVLPGKCADYIDADVVLTFLFGFLVILCGVGGASCK